MKRRTFIKSTAAVAAASALAPSILKGKKLFDAIPNEQLSSFEDDNIVIIIEMFGGNDGLNTIIPIYNDEYYNLLNHKVFTLNEVFTLMKNNLYATFMKKEDKDRHWEKISKIMNKYE